LPERAPGALVADKAYDSDAIRNDLKQRGIRAVIPPKSNRTKTVCYDKPLIVSATASSGCSAISRSTAPPPHDMNNLPIASSECYISQPRVTGSNFVHAA
jgi:hypothetical protein